MADIGSPNFRSEEKLRPEETTSKMSTEILIIGGGIAGTSTAYYLSQYGHDVTLLEQSEIAAEASGLNAGTLWATGWGTPADLSTTLSMGGLQIYQSLQFDLGFDIEFRQCGALKVIQTEEEYSFISAHVHDLKLQGHNVELLKGRDARCVEPELSPHLLGSLYYPLGASADPVKTTRAFASAAQQHGTRIHLNHTVSAIASNDNGTFVVTTPQAVFHTKILLIAAGPWSRSIGAMLGLNIPVYAVRGQMWSTGPLPTRIFHTIGAAESALYWHKYPGDTTTQPLELTHQNGVRLTRHLYGRQTRDGEIIFGGDRQLNQEKVPDQGGIETNREHSCEIFPFLRSFPIQRTWAGWMPFTPSLEPLIGQLPSFEHLYILSGLSSSGFEQGPMAGKLLADYIHSGVASPVLAAADPARQVSILPT
jgi:sarcosine oxidase, subunit beta